MSKWKGLILAGGTGSRLFPLTHAVNKHLMPVYDKPMIYYPLTTLMLGGIRDFVVVSAPETLPQLKQCLGDGRKWGISLDYVVQDKPRGIAHGFIAAEQQLQGKNVALVLGDNIFYGTGLPLQIRKATEWTQGATIFGYEVVDPKAFGVVTLDGQGNPIALEEKPKDPHSNLAVPGLYFYDPDVIEIAKSLSPSARGELEITDVNRHYLNRGALRVSAMGRGTAWLDGGTHEALFEATQFVKVLSDRTGMQVACPEEIAYRMGYISVEALDDLVPKEPKTNYHRYLRSFANRELMAHGEQKSESIKGLGLT